DGGPFAVRPAAARRTGPPAARRPGKPPAVLPTAGAHPGIQPPARRFGRPTASPPATRTTPRSPRTAAQLRRTNGSGGAAVGRARARGEPVAGGTVGSAQPPQRSGPRF